jgi:cation diffusion facilitator CzcD-associated flavoprotein CzcO
MTGSQHVTTKRRRLAIIGGGSSGLICLKYALDLLPDWDIVCFEKSDNITGCWGNPYPGFVSTSTKYTTQFSCFPKFDASVQPDHGESRSEFFCDGQYGAYLEEFAEAFKLLRHIALQTHMTALRRGKANVGWELSISCTASEQKETTTERFDHVIVCTGLSAEPKPIESDVDCLTVADLNRPEGLGHVTGKRIVVIGGGESAVDYANRLAKQELGNEVFLALKSGIRVSPRYHPIRGVPSDFLRNRLMLSIHEDLRNRIGQRFVEARILYQEIFERLFPKSHRGLDAVETPADVREQCRQWTYKLTKTAKDDLFNMFHNKSDDFLDAVAQGRITIVGAPVDDCCQTFCEFDGQQIVDIQPDLIVPAIGYRARLDEISAGDIQLPDFYLGCCHVTHPDLYLVGFARPIIGNIPTISEIQAKYVCGLIAGKYVRPAQIAELHQTDLARRKSRYKKLKMDAVFPVEMFPYCDHLAKLMGDYPTLHAAGRMRAWVRMQLTPATTMHYFCGDPDMQRRFKSTPVYMPSVLILFLLALKPLDFLYRVLNVR